MKKFIEQAEAITRAYSEQYWAATDAVAKGTPPKPPSAYKTSVGGHRADIETLPARAMIMAALKAGKAGSVTVGGEEIPYDFTGVGALQQQLIDLQGQEQAAKTMARMVFDIQREYGPKMAQQQRAQLEDLDPEYYASRKGLGEQMLSELKSDRDLTTRQRQNVEGSVRGGQVARGNVLGPANIAQEALAKFDVGEKLRQQRLSNVQGYLRGGPISTQLGTLAGAQQGAAPFMPQPLPPSAVSLNPNAAGQSMSFAAQNYGSYIGGLSRQSNPWMTGLGFGLGMLGGPAGGALGGLFGGAAGVAGPGGMHLPYQGGAGLAYTAGGY